MKISTPDFDKILTDNEISYVDFVKAAIEHSDPSATVSIRKNSEGLLFTITPSTSDFKQDIINDLLGVHKLLKIKIIFSKSLGIQKLVSFSVVM